MSHHVAIPERIDSRLRRYDPHHRTDGDFIPCWCHGRWFHWNSWRGLVKRRRR